MLRKLVLAGLLAASITGCMGASDERPTPTVMGEQTGPGTSAPGATASVAPANFP